MSLQYDKLIFELSTPGTEGMSLPGLDVPDVTASDVIPAGFPAEKRGGFAIGFRAGSYAPLCRAID